MLGRATRLTQRPRHRDALSARHARLDMFSHGQGFPARERADEIALDSDLYQLARPSNRVVRRAHLSEPV
jgi:hypothetical protein